MKLNPIYRIILAAIICLSIFSQVAHADTCLPIKNQNFGGKVIVMGDSFSENLQSILLKNWFKDTQEDELLGEDAPHIQQMLAIGRSATGLNLPMPKNGKFWHDHFTETVEKNNFQQGDIAVIWVGANDNQDIQLTDSDRKLLELKNVQTVSRNNDKLWWKVYVERIAKIVGTCVERKMDCYWITATHSAGSAMHVDRMSKINSVLRELVKISSNHLTVLEEWTLRDEYPGSDWAHPNAAGFQKASVDLNQLIKQRRGFDLQALANEVRQCRLKTK